jgi:hypothetical protein
MCAKNFPLEVFWRYLFFKKGSKQIQKAYGKMPYAFSKKLFLDRGFSNKGVIDSL